MNMLRPGSQKANTRFTDRKSFLGRCSQRELEKDTRAGAVINSFGRKVIQKLTHLQGWGEQTLAQQKKYAVLYLNSLTYKKACK